MTREVESESSRLNIGWASPTSYLGRLELAHAWAVESARAGAGSQNESTSKWSATVVWGLVWLNCSMAHRFLTAQCWPTGLQPKLRLTNAISIDASTCSSHVWIFYNMNATIKQLVQLQFFFIASTSILPTSRSIYMRNASTYILMSTHIERSCWAE